MKKRWSTIFQDDHIHVIDKPSGLLTIPDRYKPDLPNIQDIFKRMDQNYRMVHRLDKETSGLLILAKTSEAHKELNAQFNAGTIRKLYNAIVEGLVSRPAEVEVFMKKAASHKQVITDRDGKRSLSLIRPIEVFKGWSLVEIELKTGRTHQARVHCAHIGHPIVADPMYGSGKPLTIEAIKPGARSESSLLERVALHAAKISFTHPATGEMISLEASWPKDFRASINQLRKWRKTDSR